jgi:TP901 family phage tail tape measure protein
MLKIDKLQLEIAINGDESRQELMKLEKASKALKQELRRATDPEDIKRLKNELGATESKMEDLRAKIGLTGMTMKELQQRANTVKMALNNLVPKSELHTKYKAELESINARLTELRVGATKTGFSFGKMADGFNKYFGMITAGLAVLSGFALSLKSIITGNAKLDDSFADIRKTTGMTTEEVKALNSQLGKINTRTSRDELRQIAVVAGQLGIAKDQVFGFTKAVDQLNVALGDEFQGGAEQVSKEMGTLRNVFTDIKSNNVAEDMLHIGNAINQLGAAGFATGPVMADFSNRIGGVGISLGLTTGQVLGMSATLQELNVNAERGGTAVSKIMQKMTVDTAKFATVAGMDVKEFTALVNKDLYGAFIKVVEGSQKSGASATAMGGILNELGVDGAGAAEVFTKLGKNTALLKEKVDLANTSLKDTNSITNEFNIKNNTLGAKLEKIGKVMKAVFVENGVKEALSGMVDGLYKWMGLNVSSELEKEQSQVNSLTIQLMNANLPASERNRLYAELKTIAPDILKGIEQENINYIKLRENLRLYNEQMVNKIILARKDEDIEANNEKNAKLKATRIERETQLTEELRKAAELTASISVSEGAKAFNILYDVNKNMEQKATAMYEFIMAKRKSILTQQAGELSTANMFYQAALKEENQLTDKGVKLQEEKLKLMEKLQILQKEDPTTLTNPNPDPNSGGSGTPELTEEQKKAIEAAKKLAEEQRKARQELINSGVSDREKEYGRYREHLQKLGLVDANYNVVKRKLTAEEQQAQEIAFEIHSNNIAELDKKEADEALKRKQEKFKKLESQLTEAHARELDNLEIAENNKLLAEGKTDADRDRIHNEFNTKREANELAFLLMLKKMYEEAGLDTVQIDKRISKERLAQYEEGNKELIKLLKDKEDILGKYGGLDDTAKDEQLRDSELAKLETLHSAKLISEEEYLLASEAINMEFENKQFDRYRVYAQSISGLFDGLSNAVNGAQDLQLKKVESTYNKELAELDKKHKKGLISDESYNKQKTALEEQQQAEEKAIKKKYADTAFALQVGQIISSTAAAGINAYQALAIIPVVGPVLGIAAAGAAVAYGGIQIAAAKAERDKAKGYATGGYTGSGGIYEPAGIVHKDEYVIPSHVFNQPYVQMNMVPLLEAIRLNKTGYATGGPVQNTTAAVSPPLQGGAGVVAADPEIKQLIAQNTQLLNLIYQQGVFIAWSDADTVALNKRQSQIAFIEAKASRK